MKLFTKINGIAKRLFRPVQTHLPFFLFTLFLLTLPDVVLHLKKGNNFNGLLFNVLFLNGPLFIFHAYVFTAVLSGLYKIQGGGDRSAASSKSHFIPSFTH